MILPVNWMHLRRALSELEEYRQCKEREAKNVLS